MSEKTEIVVREATDEDCVQIYDLMKKLADHHDDGHQFELTLDDLKQIGFNNKSYLRGIVAETHANGSKEIIGCGVYFYAFEVYRGRYIDSTGLMIKPRFRRKGVASALNRVFCMFLLKNDIKLVKYLFDMENEDAIDFYKPFRPVDATGYGRWRTMEVRPTPLELQKFSEGVQALPFKSLL